MFEQHSQDLRCFMQRTYQDQCSVTRSVDAMQANGTTQTDFKTVYQNVPCRLARISTRRAVFSQHMPQVQIQSDAKLYVDINVELEPGDQITITHLQQNLCYECGDIYSYASHQECLLKKVVDV